MTAAKAPTLKQAKKAALQIHSLIVRHNGNGCAAEGVLPGVCGDGRQCAHILPKARHSYVATDIDNGWVLCNGHHRMVDTDPARWLQLVEQTVGVGSVRLMRMDSDGLREHMAMSPLRWWRIELARLHAYATRWGVDLSTVPAYVKAWARQQQHDNKETTQ